MSSREDDSAMRKTPKGTVGPSIEALIYQAQKDGILPITSECDMACTFCSNQYNPPACEIHTIGHRSLDDIRDSIPWLQAAPGPLVIGESVTRINEGEPLTHPDFREIMRMVRDSYPDRAIRVTTNGALLTPELIDILQALDVELVVSLNTVGKRREIMGDRDPERTLANVRSLAGRLRFDGSIVALPFITGWDDLRETTALLRDSGASTIRLLLPGFSSRHPLFRKMPSETWRKVKELSAGLAQDLRIPVLFEPPGITDVRPTVEHVLKGSPAEKAGILPGDAIVRVGGLETFSRKDAFETCWARENPPVTLERDGTQIDVTLRKARREPPGIVMYEDLDREAYLNWERSSLVRKGKDVLVLTSSLAKPIIESALERRGLKAKVVAVKSLFFGGNIEAGGLLVVRDFLAAYRGAVSDGYAPVEVDLPRIAFDPWGRDLEGVHYRTFAEKTGLPLVLAG